jgi:hypothetical protein
LAARPHQPFLDRIYMNPTAIPRKKIGKRKEKYDMPELILVN